MNKIPQILLSAIALLTINIATIKAQNIPPYYTQRTQAAGITIVSSDRCPDSCLTQISTQVEDIMSALRPDVRQELLRQNMHIVAMGRYEGITQLPEYNTYPGIEPWWDIHVRSMGATKSLPITLCAEENVLAYQIDPNYAEDQLISAMAKSILALGVTTTQNNAMQQLTDLYNAAISSGKWAHTTAANSPTDYWAEGVQDWFGVNGEAPLPNGLHNWVNTRADLKRYDPKLHDFIGIFLRDDVQLHSYHTNVNLYTKDDHRAYARLNKEKKLNIEVPTCQIEPVSAQLAQRLRLDTKFYKKHVDSNGIHILSSANVPDSVLRQAHKTIYCMTSMLPRQVLDAMTRVDTRVVVMGQKEVTIDVPEHAGMARDRSLNWNLRARGLGGTLREPITSCAEENVMAYAWDKYHAEDILIHEFSHSIHLIGILQVDPTINRQLQDLLAQARAEGLWENTYAGGEYAEYWAEGVQCWFNVNAETPRPDTKHNPVNTREELRRYDPRLYALIAKYFPETNAQIGKHKKENLYNYE